MGPSCLDPGPCRCSALPKVALDLVLQHSISAPSFLCCTWERDPFLDLSCVAFITAFVVCVHLCHAPFHKPVFLLLQGYLAVFNCTTLLLYCIVTNGILSRSVTLPNILDFYVTVLNTSFLR